MIRHCKRFHYSLHEPEGRPSGRLDSGPGDRNVAFPRLGWLRAFSAALAAAFGWLLIANAIAAEFPSTLPMTARSWNDRGSKFAREQQWQPAIDAFTEAIKLAPERSELLVNRGVAWQKIGEWERAEADCTAAAKINPEDTRAFLQRAIARTELGRHQEAFQDASRAVRMEPENAQCVFIRHLTASRIGRHDLGHVAGENYIGIQGWFDPWSPYVALLNYVALRRAGDEAAARNTLAEAAAVLSPTDWPTPVFFYLRGDLEEAGLLALATEPDRATLARYYIGMNKWLDGNSTKARELFAAIAATGDQAYLQTKLAGDHLREINDPETLSPPPSEE
jgi:tetratricopeptide (TPR) repeat protein